MICTDMNLINEILDDLERNRCTENFLYKERIYISYNNYNLNELIHIAIHENGSCYRLTLKPQRIRLREFEITIFAVVHNNKAYFLKEFKIENIYERFNKMEFNF